MRLYVWQGKNVLQNYGTGLVVVPAENTFKAWLKLRNEKPETFFRLFYGRRFWDGFETLEEAVADLSMDDLQEIHREGFPIAPTEYDTESLPIIVFEGSA